ncbi:serine/threonine-protein kinase [Candidatus Laterigemmans baculatus]|uniref:serine/threonine-protein kinase n=1 Tax=Candidatus Laterigemmans baculatus TaxID=2770505 RepID=UPI0013DBCB63|nr:serine/threonine-protein kinase [Candidatus Laterigemmans baculatus]
MAGKDDQHEPPVQGGDDSPREPEALEPARADSGFTDDLLTVPSAATTNREGERTRRFDEAQPVLELPFPVPLDPPRQEGSLGRMGCYEILNVVGRGGMGIVARAFDEQLHRNVAIKVMSHQLLSSERAQRRFLREARAAASINHPNVVTIHAVSEKDDTPYLVMEYVDGQPLQARIQKDAPLPYEDVLRIGAQIASGLAAAHRHGIIHRDIKPGNVMLEDRIERVKLTDFGLARLVQENSDLTSLGDLVGTPAYMSPEQVDGKDLTPASDLFSLGCVLYAMFAGKSPFHASTSFATATRVRDFQPKPIASLVDDIPAEFDQLVSRLLSKNPKVRPRSAEEVAALLLEWSAQTHQARLSGNSLDRAAKAAAKTKRHLLRRHGVTAALAILISGGVWSFFRSPPSNATRVETEQRKDWLADGVLQVHPESGEFRSLSAALAAAQPDSTIELLPARYYETIEITDADRLAGLTIVGQDGVRVAGPLDAPVIHIAGVPNCELRDLVIEASETQNGVIVAGNCPGLHFSRVRFETQQPEKMKVGMLFFEGGGTGASEDPIEVSNCWFDAGAVGLVIGSLNPGDAPVEHVHVHHNRIQAASETYGIPIVVQGRVHDLRIERNLLLQGRNGLSISLPTAESATKCVFRHNTLSGFQNAFNCNLSDIDQDIRIEENLVAEARTLHANSGDPAQYSPWFSGNQWIVTPEVERSIVESMFAMISPENVESLDPDSPAFSKPSAQGRGKLVGMHVDTQ